MKQLIGLLVGMIVGTLFALTIILKDTRERVLSVEKEKV